MLTKRLEQLAVTVGVAILASMANALVQLDAADLLEPREWLVGLVTGLAAAVGASLLGFTRLIMSD